ncbi:hypothetical protein Dsin_019595 [Dipteronia sinensis]|uniref:CCHC-type domain-containing protein n=1 Tax=Dipteronia sinensis TaxID=43782 RepID=A0AAE0A8D1_9ROSI|nr:hypothetical protein Dsin_019595 [Dipteronia sinensis]
MLSELFELEKTASFLIEFTIDSLCFFPILLRLVPSSSLLKIGSEDIAKLCANLTLLEIEGPVLRLQDGLKAAGLRRLALSLVGKVLTNRLVNCEVFIGVLRKIWRVKEGVEIEFVSNNIFTFQFKSVEDRRRILAGGPWTFDGALIVLEAPTGKGDIKKMNFNHTEFWVQIHRVPLLCMTKEIGHFLGVWWVWLWMWLWEHKGIARVSSCGVDVLGDGDETMMLLKYERMSIHCFRCGRLGHSISECVDNPITREDTGREELPFGAWLLAAPPDKQWRRKSNYQSHYLPVRNEGPCSLVGNSVSDGGVHLSGVNAVGGFEIVHNDILGNNDGSDCRKGVNVINEETDSQRGHLGSTIEAVGLGQNSIKPKTKGKAIFKKAHSIMWVGLANLCTSADEEVDWLQTKWGAVNAFGKVLISRDSAGTKLGEKLGVRGASRWWSRVPQQDATWASSRNQLVALAKRRSTTDADCAAVQWKKNKVTHYDETNSLPDIEVHEENDMEIQKSET